MYEFKWTLPGDAPQTVTLRITSKSSWIGCKTLRLGEHLIYRRGRLEGIEHTFHDRPGGRTLHLKAEPIPGSPAWRPVVLCDGVVLREVTGCQAPPSVERPPLLAVVTGITYLAIFMIAVMLPHIWNILYASKGHSDSRIIVLEVNGETRDEGLTLSRGLLPEATVGLAYEAELAVARGSPPYSWKLAKGRLPDGLAFDAQTARVFGVPRGVEEKLIRVRVTDATGAQVEQPYVVSVRPAKPMELRLLTRALPPARAGEAYTAELRLEGGKPPFDWVVNTRKLPRDLAFDREEGKLGGVVRADTRGMFPLEFRVTDSAYSPFQDIAPWPVPFATTAICLLGYWNMRRQGVILYGVLLLGQGLAGMFTVYPWSWMAMIAQLLVFGVGAVYYRRMR